MDDKIYITIARVLQGEASEGEIAEVNDWVKADEKNAGIYAELKQLWAEADFLNNTVHFDTDKAWGKVSERLSLQDGGITEKKPTIIVFPKWIKYSSAFAALLLLGFFLFNPFQSQNVQVLADAGNKRVTLPDGSIVSLKAGSKLSYPEEFKENQRSVSLEGEAFFEVTRSPQQPFVVEANPVEVTVLGTTFGVKTGSGTASVTVSSGKVQVATTGKEVSQLILTPGKSAAYRNNQLSEIETHGDEFFWMDKTLSFQDQPLKEVLSAIAAATDTPIEMAPGMTSEQQHQLVTISFRNQTVEDMLTELCLITSCKWEKKNNRYIVLTN